MGVHIPLLLAPAGSPDALIAACAAGADAVYLGGRHFGARQFATNFTDEELADAIRYAHVRGIQVYVTVNTLITEREIPGVLNYLSFLYQSGVDAVLIQDIGLLSLASKAFPELTIHASTQMGVHNAPGALYAARHGCTRIVLARELTGEEIEEIAHSLGDCQVDLEIFAHGALCYGYSGKCLLSSLVGGRSGNRGMCAQPCRKPYQLMSGEYDQWGRMNTHVSPGSSGYFLSTKDLSLYPVLDQIVRLPIAALKIEGRMRSPEYVATVVSVYRKALDSIRDGTFHPDSDDIANLSIAFSRGFTTGYISGSDFSEVMGREYPGNQGYLIGTIRSYGRGRVQVQLSSGIVPRQGDGLVIRDTDREEGLVLRESPVANGDMIEIPSPFHASPGSFLYITKRKELDLKIRALLANPDERYAGSLVISCSVIFSCEGEISAAGAVCDETGKEHLFTFISPERVEPAKTRSLSKEQIIEQLNKTGGTLFSFSHISISGEEGWFAPIRVLNTLRRDILSAAEESIMNSSKPSHPLVSNTWVQLDDSIRAEIPDHSEQMVQHPMLVTIVSSVSEGATALEHGADLVYLLWHQSCEDVSPLSRCFDKIGIMIPGVIRSRELDSCVEDIRKMHAAGIRHVLVDSVGIGEYVHELFPDIIVSGYYGLAIANNAAVQACEPFLFCTLSPELSEQEIHDLCRVHQQKTGPKLAICCQGLIEAIVTEDNVCRFANGDGGRHLALRDEKKYSFPVMCEDSGRTHILNSSEHCLFDECPALQKSGIKWFIIDARGRGEKYTGVMTDLWKRVIQNNLSGDSLAEIREKIMGMSSGGITRSGYRRGLAGMK